MERGNRAHKALSIFFSVVLVAGLWPASAALADTDKSSVSTPQQLTPNNPQQVDDVQIADPAAEDETTPDKGNSSSDDALPTNPSESTSESDASDEKNSPDAFQNSDTPAAT